MSLAGLLVASIAVACVGCDSQDEADHDAHANGEQHVSAPAGAVAGEKVAIANISPSQAATTQPTLNNVTGVVTFTQNGEQVRIVAEINGLTPNTTHGFHIHEKGDLSAPDLSSAGPHFNPAGHKHGGPESEAAHAGDLGNITADADGHAHHEITSNDITLGEGEHSVIGKSVLIHAKADDLKTDPSGDSGARIAGGVIQTKNQ